MTQAFFWALSVAYLAIGANIASFLFYFRPLNYYGVDRSLAAVHAFHPANAMKTKLMVKCVDDSGRPNEIPTTHWVIAGEAYIVVSIGHSNMQSCDFFVLEEIDLKSLGTLFHGFSVHRFIPI